MQQDTGRTREKQTTPQHFLRSVRKQPPNKQRKPTKTLTQPQGVGIQATPNILPTNSQHKNSRNTATTAGIRDNLPNSQTRHSLPLPDTLRRNTNLNADQPPLTKFEQKSNERHIYDTYVRLYKKLQNSLRRDKLKTFQVDKGPGLIILHESTLTELYKLYLNKEATIAETAEYIKILRDLKIILYMTFDNRQMSKTDDRAPTIYFKFKTHMRPLLLHKQHKATK